MKRTVLTFGLISGVMSSVMMLLTVPFLDRIGFDYGEILGYSAIVLTFLLVFFGRAVLPRQCRRRRAHVRPGARRRPADHPHLVRVLCRDVGGDLLQAGAGVPRQVPPHTSSRRSVPGATPEQLQATAVRMEQFKTLYQKPLVNIAFTFLEPFPIGFLVSLISAGVLRRRAGPGYSATAGSAVR